MTSARGTLAGPRRVGAIELPAHRGSGGFDHADVDGARGLLYVAHTANDAVDVVDLRTERYVRSVPGLIGVAGALVDEASGMVFTSNRGENTVALWSPGDAAPGDVAPGNVAPGDTPTPSLARVAVGARPNGLAFDRSRGLLLCANVGDPAASQPPSVTMVDVPRRSVVATIVAPGRTRWAIFDPMQELFFVNVSDPAVILVIDPRQPDAIARRFRVPARGPHGLDLDAARARLYCACDDASLVTLNAQSGDVLGRVPLSGAPDVVFLNRGATRLYVAIGDPGVLDVVDVERGHRWAVVETEHGAHTLAVDRHRARVYVFLPHSHRVAVIEDGVV